MSKIDSSGPAFPIGQGNEHLGMSLRDWFAGQAMAELVAMATDDGNFKNNESGSAACLLIAAASYQMADAMLAARKKGGES